jgi:acetylornithine deacetylase/succinyl-diaminopimelate desuccinylase-like protein
MLNSSELYQYISNQWEETIIPSLIDYIKIPNKSPDFDDKWFEHGYMEQAVELISNWCEQNAPKNMEMQIVRLEGRTPLIFMDIPGQCDNTVVLYGHLDKQPEMEGWDDELGPWKPVLKDGKLYGRGGADDGYAAFASLTAINALQKQNIPHARCIVIIEACEESGSYDLPFYIEHLKPKIGEPELVVFLDSGAGNYEQLWITTSLRGNIVGELSTEVIKEGVHSGNASGIVADSFRVATQLIARIENNQSGEITLPELHVEIPNERIEQAAVCAEVLGDKVFSEFPFHPGVKPVSDDKQQLVLNRTWKPALSITGAGGLPTIANAGNVSRPITSLKLSMRIPPTCCPKTASDAMQKALTDNPPYNTKVTFNCDDGALGWNAPPQAEWLSDAMQEASTTYYQKPVVYMGEGGTIPFMGMLGDKFPNAQFMITGVLGPSSNAHGPNEFLHIEMGKKVTACVSHVLFKHYQQCR